MTGDETNILRALSDGRWETAMDVSPLRLPGDEIGHSCLAQRMAASSPKWPLVRCAESVNGPQNALDQHGCSRKAAHADHLIMRSGDRKNRVWIAQSDDIRKGSWS
jgi:hypothetical protein